MNEYDLKFKLGEMLDELEFKEINKMIDAGEITVKFLEDFVLFSKVGEYIYNIATNIPNVNVRKCFQALIELKMWKYVIALAQNASPELLKKFNLDILNSNDLNGIVIYAQKVSTIDITEFVKKVISLKEKYCYSNLYYYVQNLIRMFNIPNAPQKLIIKEVVDAGAMGCTQGIIDLAIVSPELSDFLTDALIEIVVNKTKAYHHLLLFASKVPNVAMDKLTDALIKSKDMEYLMELKKFPNVDTTKIDNAIKDIQKYQEVVMFEDSTGKARK